MADNLNRESKESFEKVASSKQLVVPAPEDRLSDLPQELQSLVLSSLPLQVSLKTTILSKMWRKIWHSLPHLIFDYSKFPDMEGKLDHFLGFIHHALIHHDKSNIRTFELYLKECDSHIKNEWVTFAVHHSVQELVLRGRVEDLQQLPVCLFNSSSLTTLDLAVEKLVIKWPAEISMPKLKEVSLQYVILSEENFILDLSSCPALEILSMILCNAMGVKVLSISCHGLKTLQIAGCLGIEECYVKLDTPSLVHFVYMDCVAQDYNFPNFSCLSFACVSFKEAHQLERRNAFSQLAIKASLALCNVKHLHLNELFMEFLARAPDVSRQLTAISFDKLDALTLELCPTKEQVQMTFLLLARCPNVRGIIIDITRSEGMVPDMLGGDLDYGNLAFPLMFKRLKFVKIDHFGGNKSEMELARVFFENAPEFLEIIIEMELSLTSNETKQTVIELLMLKDVFNVNLSLQ